MQTYYEIFIMQEDMIEKNNAINTLLGYPKNGTENYRPNNRFEHPITHKFAGGINSELTNACSKMTSEEKATYYDDSDLKSWEWLIENGWFTGEPV